MAGFLLHDIEIDDLELYPYKCIECGRKLTEDALGYDLNYNESIYCDWCDEEWLVERDEVTGRIEEIRR